MENWLDYWNNIFRKSNVSFNCQDEVVLPQTKYLYLEQCSGNMICSIGTGYWSWSNDMHKFLSYVIEGQLRVSLSIISRDNLEEVLKYPCKDYAKGLVERFPDYESALKKIVLICEDAYELLKHDEITDKEFSSIINRIQRVSEWTPTSMYFTFCKAKNSALRSVHQHKIVSEFKDKQIETLLKEDMYIG